jgi:hypothetical protein
LIAKQTAHAERGDQDAGERRADDARRVEEARVQGDRVRELLAAHHLEGERVAARRVEDERRAGQDRQQVDHPERLEAAEHEHGEEQREAHHQRLRRDHELAVLDPVGDDAGDEAEDGEGDEAAERERPDGERRVRELDHEPGERHVLHPGPADGDDLAGEEEPVVAVALQARKRARV